jgi:GH24 family phage-related lysozyme (muramidase)
MYNNYNIQIRKSIHDPVKEAMSVAISDTMHNLDLTNEANLELYNQQKLKYIAMFEGRESKAYDDDYGRRDPKYADQIFAAGKQPKGNITVGYGFNMDSLGARAEWNRILKNEISFDEVRKGRAELNDDQMMRLLKHSVNIREIELRRSYKEVWNKLRANERIAVLSAYYNSPKLVNTSTRFFGHLKKYTETGDLKHQRAAIAELESCRKDPSLISRREK